MIATKARCSFEGCDRPRRGRIYCDGHYSQMNLGTPLRPLKWKRRPKGVGIQVVYDEVPCPRHDLEGPCHIYRGCKSNGYGRAWDGKRNVLVHKHVWESAHGPVPPKLEIDHQCHNRGCCNINHLRVVTRKINVTENVIGHPWQLGKAKTHCHRGHEFTQDNIRLNKSGSRVCKICERMRASPHLYSLSH